MEDMPWTRYLKCMHNLGSAARYIDVIKNSAVNARIMEFEKKCLMNKR